MWEGVWELTRWEGRRTGMKSGWLYTLQSWWSWRLIKKRKREGWLGILVLYGTIRMDDGINLWTLIKSNCLTRYCLWFLKFVMV